MELIKSVLEEPIDPLEQEEVKVSFKPSEEDEVESAIEEEVVVKDITKNKKTKYCICRFSDEQRLLTMVFKSIHKPTKW